MSPSLPVDIAKPRSAGVTPLSSDSETEGWSRAGGGRRHVRASSLAARYKATPLPSPAVERDDACTPPLVTGAIPLHLAGFRGEEREEEDQRVALEQDLNIPRRHTRTPSLSSNASSPTSSLASSPTPRNPTATSAYTSSIPSAAVAHATDLLASTSISSPLTPSSSPSAIEASLSALDDVTDDGYLVRPLVNGGGKAIQTRAERSYSNTMADQTRELLQNLVGGVEAVGEKRRGSSGQEGAKARYREAAVYK